MGRKVLVTGASSEIGAAICAKVLKPGDEALLHYSGNLEKCRKLADALTCLAELIKADFSSGEEVDALCARAGEADVLINVAATVEDSLLVQLSDQSLERMAQVNIVSLTRVTRAALYGMMMRRCGIVVNISSVLAKRGNRGTSVYAGTKGFMESFSRALAAEYGPRGIRVNCVAPGAIDAGSFKTIKVDLGKKMIDSIALRKTGTAEDVANAVAFLCSEEASFITGAVIPVDGGLMLGV